MLGAVVALLVSLLATPVAAAPPSNDDRGDATTIGSVPFSDSVDTTEATDQASDIDCGGNTVWYSFTPSVSGRYVALTLGSDYDTMLAVAAVTGGGLDVIGCDDDGGRELDSRIIWSAQAGQEYLIMAGTCCGGGEGGGNLEFSLERAPRKPQVSISIAARGFVNRMGGAVVHGRVECRHAAGARGSVSASVRQPVGQLYIRGYGEKWLFCDHMWRLRIRGDIGRFRAGRVTVRASAELCNDGGCDFDRERRIVRLRQAD
jgi:hypothetical protein